MNWGMLPFTVAKGDIPFKVGELIFIPDLRDKLEKGGEAIKAHIIGEKGIGELHPLSAQAYCR